MKRRRGFTLLELLTAMSIMVIVCGFILKIGSQVLDTWGRASKSLESKDELELVLDMIEGDLETSLPYYWTYDVMKGGVESVERLCFYGYGETDIQNAIAYEVGYDERKGEYAIYRYVRKGNKGFDITEKLEEVMSVEKVSSKEIVKLPNLLARNVTGLLVKFYYRDLQGKMQWTMKAPFLGTAICVDVIVRGKQGEKLCRRITLVGVGLL